MGPWGLCTLERIIAHAAAGGVHLEVHVIEPGVPGVGIYDVRGPDYLVMNNVCGDIALSDSTSGSVAGRTRAPPQLGR
jgi:hypothetical protein